MRLSWPRMIFQGAEREKSGEGPALRTSLLKIPIQTGAVQCFPAVEPGKGDFFFVPHPPPAGRANPQTIPGLSLNRILPAKIQPSAALAEKEILPLRSISFTVQPALRGLLIL